MENQKPDGLILDTEERAIYIIEGARCCDTAEAIEIVEVTKIHKQYTTPPQHAAYTCTPPPIRVLALPAL